MPKFTASIKRTILDTYSVEAKSKTEAAVKLGGLLAGAVPPDTSTELSSAVISVAKDIDDDPAA